MNASSVNGAASGRPHILISGAGMGGLTLAVALLQKGFDVDIYEQASELREIGAGLWISSNGGRVLQALGLKKAIEHINLPPDDRVIRLWNTGETRSVYNRDPNASSADHTLIMVLRAELQRTLYEAVISLKPSAVHFGARTKGCETVGDRVRLLLEDGSVAEGDVLVGADGNHSKVRQALFGPALGKYTGAVAWRGLVPMSKLGAQHRRPIASTWIGPTAHVTSYPVRRGTTEMVSFSGQADSEQWDTESWSEPGKLSEALLDFDGWHQDIIDLLVNAETLFKWGLFVREPLSNWTEGRVTLLGDACHSMVPYLGMGVNITMEDAYVLARCLEAVPTNPQEALRRYEDARLTRGNLTAVKSMEMFKVFHSPDLAKVDTAVPYIEKQWSAEAIRGRYDWLLAYDANTIEV